MMKRHIDLVVPHYVDLRNKIEYVIQHRTLRGYRVVALYLDKPNAMEAPASVMGCHWHLSKAKAQEDLERIAAGCSSLTMKRITSMARRCRDCKHYDAQTWRCANGMGGCGLPPFHSCQSWEGENDDS